MSLINELKRRNVLRVGIAYALIAWVLLQGADFALDLIDAPNWVIQALFVLALIGLPAVLIFAWVFEMTPEGIKRESQIDRSQSITPRTGRKLDRVIIVFLVLVITLMIAERLWLVPGKMQTAAEPATATAEPVKQQPGESRPSIAVLPFANRSRAEDDAFFVDGVHDDLLTQLARISALKVISRTSVMSYRDTEKPIPLIGRELGVSTVMEGSVQRAGDRIRINVQLIDATSDEHLWAEIYDRELTAANIFEIQSEIATAIAGALRAALTLQESERLASRPTENLAAYEAFLLGRQSLARRTTSSIAEATNYFQQAVNLDPQFALAYVGLADAWQLQVDYGGLAVELAVNKAQPLVEKALQLDDQLGEAYNSLASIREYARDYEAAERNYRRAVELAPNYADAAHWYGLFLMQSLGLPQRSIPWFEKALELNPLSAITLSNYANALEQLGRFDESLAAIRKSLAMHAEGMLAPLSMAYYEADVNGRRDEAIRWILKGLAIDSREPGANADMARLFSELGDQRAASCWLARARELGPTSAVTASTQAQAALFAGDHEQAVSAALLTLENAWVGSSKALPLAVFKVIRQQEGRSEEVLRQYEAHYPEHFRALPSDFTRANSRAAIDLAEVLAEAGRVSDSGQLLDAAWSFIQEIPRLGAAGFGVDDARILVLRGDTEAALAALEEAVKSGWRTDWRFYLEYDSVLAPLHGHPRFEAGVDEIRRDMAEQLERVRAAGHDFGPCAEGLP
jgi:TolB-like protein